MTEHRGEERIPLSRPVVAYRVLDDGEIDVGDRVCGRSVDASGHGMRIELEEPPDGCRALCVGIENEDGSVGFTGLSIRHVESGEKVSIGGRTEEVLDSGRSAPIFDHGTMSLAHPLPEIGLERLSEHGVVRRTLLDRVLVCPRCHGLPTLRSGCRRCGSGRVSTERLVHHFACGHYAPVAAFETSRGMTCPRCRLRPLVVGSDFEYAEGAHRCGDCGWSDSSFDQVAHCLRCGHRFPAAQAIEKDVVLY